MEKNKCLFEIFVFELWNKCCGWYCLYIKISDCKMDENYMLFERLFNNMIKISVLDCKMFIYIFKLNLIVYKYIVF